MSLPVSDTYSTTHLYVGQRLNVPIAADQYFCRHAIAINIPIILSIIIIIIIIIKNEKIRATLCENAAGALYIVNSIHTACLHCILDMNDRSFGIVSSSRQ